MGKLLSVQLVAKLLLLLGCVALAGSKSQAFLLGNIIGCNSFGCRLTNLENEVNHLKNQVNRMQMNNPSPNYNGGGGGNGGNNYPNNNQMNNQNNGQQQQQQQQQQQTPNNGGQATVRQLNTSQMFPNELNRVNYGNVDYNQASTRRVNNNNNGGLFGANVANGLDGSAIGNQFFRA